MIPLLAVSTAAAVQAVATFALAGLVLFLLALAFLPPPEAVVQRARRLAWQLRLAGYDARADGSEVVVHGIDDRPHRFSLRGYVGSDADFRRFMQRTLGEPEARGAADSPDSPTTAVAAPDAVRPDGHIAWCECDACWAARREQMRRDRSAS